MYWGVGALPASKCTSSMIIMTGGREGEGVFGREVVMVYVSVRVFKVVRVYGGRGYYLLVNAPHL